MARKKGEKKILKSESEKQEKEKEKKQKSWIKNNMRERRKE